MVDMSKYGIIKKQDGRTDLGGSHKTYFGCVFPIDCFHCFRRRYRQNMACRNIQIRVVSLPFYFINGNEKKRKNNLKCK